MASKIIGLVILASTFSPQWGVPFAKRVNGGVPLPSVVQSVANTSACNFGSCSISFGSTATPGNKIIAFVWDSQNNGGLAVTDNNGNSLPTLTCTSGAQPQIVNASGPGGSLYEVGYTVPSGPAVTGLNLTFTGSFWQVIAVEVSGSTSTHFQVCSADAYTFGNLNPLPSATPTSAPVLGLACFIITDGTAVFTAGSGWTGSATSSTVTPMFVESLGQSSTASMSAPVSISRTGTAWPSAFIVLF